MYITDIISYINTPIHVSTNVLYQYENLDCKKNNRSYAAWRGFESHQSLPLFPLARNFTLIAQYWLVSGTDSSVISQLNLNTGLIKEISSLVNYRQNKTKSQTKILFHTYWCVCLFQCKCEGCELDYSNTSPYVHSEITTTPLFH